MTQNNTLARRPSGAPHLAADLAPSGWSRAYLDTIKATYARDLSDTEFALAVQVSRATGLRIDTRELWVYKRGRDEPLIVDISLDGYRAIAFSSGLFAGEEGPLFCGKDGIYTDTWLADEPPVAAKHLVWRSDIERPFVAVVLMREFRGFAGKSPVWATAAVHQLGIKAAKHAFRKGWRRELAAVDRTILDTGGSLAGEDDGPPPVEETPAAVNRLTGEILERTVGPSSAAPTATPREAWPAEATASPGRLALIERYQRAWDAISEQTGQPPRASREVGQDVTTAALLTRVEAGETWLRNHAVADAADDDLITEAPGESDADPDAEAVSP